MKLRRKGILVGLTALGVAGAVAGGVGVAQAASGPGTPVARPSQSAPYGYGAGMYAMMAGQQTCLTAAASYLGLSQADLQAQLRAGKSLADVAAAQGKPVSGLEDAMIAAVSSSLDANTTLSATQKAAILAQMRTRIDAMVHGTYPAGAAGTGMMGAGTGGTGMMGGQTRGMHW